MVQEIIRMLNSEIAHLRSRGKSELEKNMDVIQKMFGLNEQEIQFCSFLFVVSNYEAVEECFVNRLRCQQFKGRRYLANILNMTKSELEAVLDGLFQPFQSKSDSLDTPFRE